MLPEWVAQSPAPRPARRRSSAAARRFLEESGRFLESTVFAEQAARQPGLLQRLGARAKLIAIVGLLVAASFLHHLLSLWMLGAFAIIALLLSRLSPRVIFHRAMWAMPAMFALAALPAALNLITPGRALLVVYRAPGPWALGPLHLPGEVSITAPGAAGAALFVSRIAVGLLLALALTLTTRVQALLRAAYTRSTGPFVYTVAMMYRYLFLLLHTAEELHLARRARTIAPASAAQERRWAGRSIAFLFTRSRRLMEEVHLAMLARGYTGVPRTLTTSRFGRDEMAWLFVCAAVAAAALLLDRTLFRSLLW